MWWGGNWYDLAFTIATEGLLPLKEVLLFLVETWISLTNEDEPIYYALSLNHSA
jgi:hypothetical protein